MMIFYGACFSAQQAAEKALKSFLLFHNRRLRKIHDILALLEDCITIDQNFEKLRQNLTTLSPYYIATRYPIYEDLVVFDEKKANKAHQLAKEVIEFVERKIRSV